MAAFTNTATLTYNNKTKNSNVVTGELLEVLTATKSVVGGTYRENDMLTYVVTLVNSGTTRNGRTHRHRQSRRIYLRHGNSCAAHLC